MKGVSSKDLESILEFIYCGETNINKLDLDSFLDVAKELKIEGLVEPRTLHEDLISDVVNDYDLATASDTEDDANKSEVFVKIENMNDSNSSECSKFSENENPDFSSTLNSLNSSVQGKRKGKSNKTMLLVNLLETELNEQQKRRSILANIVHSVRLTKVL